jgi:hypothetical protein
VSQEEYMVLARQREVEYIIKKGNVSIDELRTWRG